MKDKIIKDLGRFLEVSDLIAIPFKWFEIFGESIVAEIEMANRSLYYEGEIDAKLIKKLEKHGFAETVTKE